MLASWLVFPLLNLSQIKQTKNEHKVSSYSLKKMNSQISPTLSFEEEPLMSLMQTSVLEVTVRGSIRPSAFSNFCYLIGQYSVLQNYTDAHHMFLFFFNKLKDSQLALITNEDSAL